jgi:hypothetical protein
MGTLSSRFNTDNGATPLAAAAEYNLAEQD